MMWTASDSTVDRYSGMQCMTIRIKNANIYIEL